MLTAWADESGSNPRLDPNTYMLAAALCEEDDVPDLRKTMEGLRTTEAKIHWHGSNDDRRRELVEAVAALPVAGFVVVRSILDDRPRRHRRKCMEELLPHLANFPCSTITFESRGPGDDRSDLDTLQKLRSRKAVDPTLMIGHAVGRAEPVLAIADIVCGAVVQARIGRPEYLERLGSAIDLRTI